MKSRTRNILIFIAALSAVMAFSMYRSYTYNKVAKTLADETLVGTGTPMLLELGAPWCGPCQQMMPVLGELSQSRSEFIVASVNVDEKEGVARDYNVSAIPLLLFLDGQGKVLYRWTGAMTKEQILGKWRELGVVE